jgi:antitoxin YefM
LEKARRNAEYLDKIDRSLQQLAEGRVVIKTMEELEEMAK